MTESMKVLALALIVPNALVWASGGASVGARPDLVEKVTRGELSEARASWWGFDAEDATDSLQAAIGSGVKKLIVDKMPTPWMVRPLKGASNQEILFERGAVVMAKKGAFHGKADFLLTYAESTNVVLSGYGATIAMRIDDYTNRTLYAWSEWRHALTLSGVRNVRVEGLTFDGSGGDGIYFGSAGVGRHCRDVVVRDVTCTRNNRQGMSVISAANLLIENCRLVNTRGTSPQSGLDIEPNRTTDVLKNVVVRNCVAENNDGCGYELELIQLDQTTEPVDIRFENCRSAGNLRGFVLFRSPNPWHGYRGSVSFSNCSFDDPKVTPKTFRLPAGEESSFKAVFTNCRVTDRSASGKMTTVDETWPVFEAAGKRMRYQLMSAALLTGAKVDDRAPGQAVKLSTAAFRGKSRFVFHADRAGEVAFKAVPMKVGRRDLPVFSFELFDAWGNRLARQEKPVVERTPFDLVFTVPEAGFYEFAVNPGLHKLQFVESAVPLAVISLNGRLEHGINGTPGDLWFRVPAGTDAFSFFVSGGGGNEKVKAVLYGTDGQKLHEADDVSGCVRWDFLDRPSEGLWRVAASRASTGCMDDFAFDLVGVPVHFFLTPEKTWTWDPKKIGCGGMDRTKLNIGVYCLGPAARTEDHIRDLRDCGVDFVTAIEGGADMRKTFDLFQKYGLGAIVPLTSPYWNEALHFKGVDIAQVLPFDNWIRNAEKHVFRRHPAVWGYDLGDEPGAESFPFFGQVVRAIQQTCPEKFLYLNLYPNCVPKNEQPEGAPNRFLDAYTYEEYIDRFCADVPLDYVCYDFYLYRQFKRRIPLSYENMRVVADACRKNGRDFWAVLQVNSDVPETYTSLNGLRFQAYQALAYGASTILWACYSPCWWHHNVLTKDGEKTEQYEKLKRANAELRTIGKYYMQFRNEATALVGDFRNPNAYFLPESEKTLQRGEKAGQSQVLKSFGNAVVFDLCASGGEALIVGDMVGRKDAKTRALFVCAADDPKERNPKRYDVCFRPARGCQVRAIGIDGARTVTRGSDGLSRVSVASNEGLLLVFRSE